MKKLNRGLFLALICSMALAGCGNSANSASETQNENTASENTVVSENENVPLNFNLKITDARTDGDELSIMYLVSLPSNDRPAADMEFEKIELIRLTEILLTVNLTVLSFIQIMDKTACMP